MNSGKKLVKTICEMAEIARDFSDKIHAQAYPLSEFWASIIKPNPVILTLLETVLQSMTRDTLFRYRCFIKPVT